MFNIQSKYCRSAALQLWLHLTRGWTWFYKHWTGLDWTELWAECQDFEKSLGRERLFLSYTLPCIVRLSVQLWTFTLTLRAVAAPSETDWAAPTSLQLCADLTSHHLSLVAAPRPSWPYSSQFGFNPMLWTAATAAVNYLTVPVIEAPVTPGQPQSHLSWGKVFTPRSYCFLPPDWSCPSIVWLVRDEEETAGLWERREERNKPCWLILETPEVTTEQNNRKTYRLSRRDKWYLMPNLEVVLYILIINWK